jgi:hypothetical protein
LETLKDISTRTFHLISMMNIIKNNSEKMLELATDKKLETFKLNKEYIYEDLKKRFE